MRERMNIHEAAQWCAESNAQSVRVDWLNPFPQRQIKHSTSVERWRQRIKRATAAGEIEARQLGQAKNSPCYYRQQDLRRWMTTKFVRREALNA